MTEYETWKEEWGPRDLMATFFECDCGRELMAERTECDRCGAHYDFRDGEVIQVAPPIGAERTDQGNRGE